MPGRSEPGQVTYLIGDIRGAGALITVDNTVGSKLAAGGTSYPVTVKSILVGNITSGAITLTYYLVPAGVAIASGYKLSGAVSYAANSLAQEFGDDFDIPAGYELWALASAATSIRCLVTTRTER